jgi:TatD DNase family protein
VNLLTDTHCHLNLDTFQDDLEALLERAWERGLRRILIPGIDVENSRSAVALAERHPNLYAAVGVHPGDASTWNDDTRLILADLASHPKVVAIGEIGLDFYRNRSPRPVQQSVFQEQLELAAELNLPVIIHNREALEETWSILVEWQEHLIEQGSPLADRPGVLHSYDGGLPEAQRAAEKHFFIGISGPVTFKNAQEKHAVAAGLPLEQTLIETDAPFLTPHPHRGRRNEPAYVALVAEKIAELHGQPVESVIQATWDNANHLFHWGADL